MNGDVLPSLPPRKPPEGAAGLSSLHIDAAILPPQSREGSVFRCPGSSRFALPGDEFPPLPAPIAAVPPPSSCPQLPSSACASSRDAVSPRRWVKSLASVMSEGNPPIIPQNRYSGTYKACPRAIIYESELEKLALKWQFTVVGKFFKMPTLTVVRSFIEKLALSGNYDVLWYDYKHVLIKCVNEFDMQKVWGKGFWHLSSSCVMRTFKYDINFSPDKESAIAPVWIAFPQLRPVHYEKSCIFNLARQIGKPLSLDEPTARGTRVSKARICIEYDVRVPPPKYVCLHVCKDGNPNEKQEFWYPVIFESIPPYCENCLHLGHCVDNCKIFKNDSHQKAQGHLEKNVAGAGKQSGKKVYNRKEKACVVNDAAPVVDNVVVKENAVVDNVVVEQLDAAPVGESVMPCKKIDVVDTVDAIAQDSPSICAQIEVTSVENLVVEQMNEVPMINNSASENGIENANDIAIVDSPPLNNSFQVLASGNEVTFICSDNLNAPCGENLLQREILEVEEKAEEGGKSLTQNLDKNKSLEVDGVVEETGVPSDFHEDLALTNAHRDNSLSPERIYDSLNKDSAVCSTPYDSVGFNTDMAKENFPIESPLQGNVSTWIESDSPKEDFGPPSPDARPSFLRSRSLDATHRRPFELRGPAFKSRLKIRSLDRHLRKKNKFYDYHYEEDYDFPHGDDYNYDPYY